MKRADFIKIIKLRSVWNIDKRKGDYTLPNGEKLSSYITDLVESQMKIDNLGIRKNGDFCFCTGGNWNTEKEDFDNCILLPEYEEDETCTCDDMERRIKALISEIIGSL